MLDSLRHLPLISTHPGSAAVPAAYYKTIITEGGRDGRAPRMTTRSITDRLADIAVEPARQDVDRDCSGQPATQARAPREYLQAL